MTGYAWDTRLGEEYSRLLTQFCHSRSALTYQQLVQVIAPSWTRLQEEYQCAWPYRMRYPSRPTPTQRPRSRHYEAWKEAHCRRWAYFDHELFAQQRVDRDIQTDPGCRSFVRGPYPPSWVGLAPPHPIRFGRGRPPPPRATNVGRPPGYRPIPPLVGRP